MTSSEDKGKDKPEAQHLVAKSILKDLGWMNGWKTTPKEVEKCREEKHQVIDDLVGFCLHRISCPICNYTYLVDTSG